MNKRIRKAGLGLLALTAIVACSDGQNPASPGFEPDLAPVRPFFSNEPAPGMSVIKRDTPLEADVSQTRLVTNRQGKEFEVGGIRVFIPRRAVNEDVEITVTALAGEDVVWEFSPHGLQFNENIKIQVEILGTSAAHLQDSMPDGALSDAIGVYFEGEAGSANPLENFDGYFNNQPAGTDLIWFETDHFSGYALAM